MRASTWRAPGAEAASAGPLRRMKLTATLALVVAAAVFVASSIVAGGHGQLLAFVRSGAEAAMVGGLADWFAVTALFRRPLGLAIPHTALIPRKKDELATKLGEFVTGYFLTPAALQRQITDAGVVARVGSWLADPDHAARVGGEAATLAERALAAVEDADIVDAIIELARRDQARRSYAPILGRLLAAAVDGGATRPLVDVLAARAHDYLDAHVDDLRPTVRRFIEDRNWVTWLVTTDRFVTKLLRDTATELGAIGEDRDHPVRVGLDRILRDVAADLCDDQATAEQVDTVVARLLDDGAARDALTGLVNDAVASLRASLVAPDGELAARIAALVARIGRRLVDDDDLRDDIEARIGSLVVHGAERYGGELTRLIRTQVGDWPAAAASRRIELAVGRDLQFIRINGTIVGALAGLAIHGLALLLPS